MINKKNIALLLSLICVSSSVHAQNLEDTMNQEMTRQFAKRLFVQTAATLAVKSIVQKISGPTDSAQPESFLYATFKGAGVLAGGEILTNISLRAIDKISGEQKRQEMIQNREEINTIIKTVNTLITSVYMLQDMKEDIDPSLYQIVINQTTELLKKNQQKLKNILDKEAKQQNSTDQSAA